MTAAGPAVWWSASTDGSGGDGSGGQPPTDGSGGTSTKPHQSSPSGGASSGGASTDNKTSGGSDTKQCVTDGSCGGHSAAKATTQTGARADKQEIPATDGQPTKRPKSTPAAPGGAPADGGCPPGQQCQKSRPPADAATDSGQPANTAATKDNPPVQAACAPGQPCGAKPATPSASAAASAPPPPAQAPPASGADGQQPCTPGTVCPGQKPAAGPAGSGQQECVPGPGSPCGTAADGRTLKSIGHTALDIAGLVPVIGEAADGVNAAWYLVEGDYKNAGISAAGMVPGLGDLAVGGKLAAAGIVGAKLVEDGTEVAAKGPKALQPSGSPPPPAATPPPPGGELHSPNFVAHPNGEVAVVPNGAQGPIPAENGKGFQFQGGSGGHGLDPRTSGLRVMDPVTGGKHPYPDGYMKYNNNPPHGTPQTVDPYTGKTVAKSDPSAHIPWQPK
ncbi:MAG TPA: hypothetical protein VGH89_40915 [Pseudonocardia sp.]